MSSNKLLSTIVKEKMTNMADNISSEKEIIEYVKVAIKEGKTELKNKKGGKKKTDNNEEKPKYSLSPYQEFMKEKQVVFKENYPELSSKERLVKIAEEWNKYKETDEYKEMNKKKVKVNVVHEEQEEKEHDVKEVDEVTEVTEVAEAKKVKNLKEEHDVTEVDEVAEATVVKDTVVKKKKAVVAKK
jgi:hypothetical protein